jgi:diguanylate cyclase (GGDEF)-like protein/PAS domain S-box-containing protein
MAASREAVVDARAHVASLTGSPAPSAGSARSDEDRQIDPIVLFERWPGAVLHCHGDGTREPMNGLGAKFADQLARLDRDPLAALLAIAADTGVGVNDRIELAVDAAVRWFECTVTPLAGDATLVVARDDTYDVNMRRALFDSRERYRALVTISSDFAWETGASGAFIFVSPHGALGYSAEKLVGRPPRQLLVDADDEEALAPFHTREPVEHAQIWLRNADGGEACLIASSVPIVNERGEWTGARGLCRDITHERLLDNELARIKMREQVVAYIVNQVREEARPQAMLDAAVAMLGRATSSAAAVYSRAEAGDYRVSASHGNWLDGSIVTEFGRLFRDEPQTLRTNVRDTQLLARAALYHGDVIGIIALARDKSAEPWDSEDEALLEAVSGQLAIALRQVADQEELERLSRIDALTGLMNRRAFEQEFTRQLGRAARTGRTGTLLYVDLDNFKAINDNFGHERGDEALQEVARTLLSMSRSYDLVARMGGDEFVVWLDETDRAGAEARARDVLDALHGLKRFSGPALPPLGASIGIAPSVSADAADFRIILGRADRAMYDAKDNGKFGWAVADPSGEAAGPEGVTATADGGTA